MHCPIVVLSDVRSRIYRTAPPRRRAGCPPRELRASVHFTVTTPSRPIRSVQIGRGTGLAALRKESSMRLVWQLLAVGAIAFGGGQAMVAFDDGGWLSLAIGLATVVLSIVAYRWVVRLTERRPVPEPGRGAAWAG